MRRWADVTEPREIFRARTATAADFVQYGARVGALLDELTDRLLAQPVVDGWSDTLVARFKELDQLWNDGPDAPLECASLDSILKAHYGAVSDSHFVAIYRREALPRATLERLLRESLERMRQCRGAWRVFIRS